MRSHRWILIAILSWLALSTIVSKNSCAFNQQTTQPAPKHPAGPAPKLPRGFFSRSITMPNESPRKYAIYVPPQYFMEDSHAWPLMVCLHGSGEIGTDGVSHTRIGLPLYIAGRSKRFPFIAVFPQAHQMWFRGQEELAIWAILDDVTQHYRIDRDRIYLTGLSMGGFATWELACARPDIFAAIVPICGAAPLEFLPNIKDMPIWAFHGAQDQNVPVRGSRDAIRVLKEHGAAPQYKEFPQAGHNCWDSAYATSNLYRWLLQQRRDPCPKVIDYSFNSGAARVWWLAMKSVTGFKSIPHVHAEMTPEGRVKIDTEGIESWAFIPTGPNQPFTVGKSILVIWNGAIIYRGEYKEGLIFKPTMEPRAGGVPTSAPGTDELLP
jgi:poly(3-hydroxybutyrate) depolymerase